MVCKNLHVELICIKNCSVFLLGSCRRPLPGRKVLQDMDEEKARKMQDDPWLSETGPGPQG